MEFTLPRIQTGLAGGALLFVVCAYLVVILTAPHLGPLDDHSLLSTIYAGKLLPFYYSAASGRFYPLDGQELNIVALLSTAPFAFYMINAAQLVIVALAFFSVNRRLAGTLPAILVVLLLLATPGVAFAWTRLQVPERGSLFFFTLFVWCYVRHATNPNPWSFAGTLAFANLALYYKEPGFLMLGAFAAARLGTGRNHADRLLNASLLGSATLFVLVYYLVIYRHHAPGHGVYGQIPFDGSLVLLRNVSDYLVSDPIIMLGVPLMAARRLYKVLRDKDILDPMADPLLLGALCYMPVFFLLGLFSTPYYLLPAYAFALPAFLLYWRHRALGRTFKIFLVGAVAVLTVTGAIPLALFSLSFNKYVPRNYVTAVSFLARHMATHAGASPTIYLDGVEPDRGIEIHVSLRRFLAAAGVSPPVRYLENWHASGPAPGDYLLITPFDTNNDDVQHLNEVTRSWCLVWSSASPLAVPNLSLKVAVKYFALTYFLPKGGAEVGANQRYVYPVDYQILVRR